MPRASVLEQSSSAASEHWPRMQESLSGQLSPHSPQCCASDSVFTQAPSQSSSPAGHLHSPSVQGYCPHSLPQAPQLLGSESVCTQTPSQSVVESPVQTQSPS